MSPDATTQVYEIVPSVPAALRAVAFASNFIPFPKSGKKGKSPGAEKVPSTKGGKGGGEAPTKPNSGKTPPREKPSAGSGSKNNKSSPNKSAESKGNCSQKCQKPGEPVDIVTGDFIQQWSLLALPSSTLPLNLTRLYRSRAEFSGHFGQKWADDWSQHLTVDEQGITYVDNEGVEYHYATPENEVYAVNMHNAHCVLHGKRDGALYLFDRRTQLAWVFERLAHQPAATRFLTAIVDYFGNHVLFGYTEQGLNRVEHTDGYRLDIKSDAWRILQIDYVNESYRQTLLTCEYRADGYLSTCRSHQFGELFHEYNEAGYMLSWRDTLKTDAEIRYDELGRVVSTQTRDGHYADEFRYDEANRCSTYHDAEGGVTKYWYNERNLVTRIEDPLGRITETRWNLSDKVSETDALGRKVSYNYNDFGEVTRVTLWNGEVYHYDYNARGQLTAMLNPHGERWVYEYGERGELLKETNPAGLTQTYRYDKSGRLLRLIGADGNYLRFDYDEQSRLLTAQWNVKGEMTRFTRDIFGRVTLITLPDNSQYRYEYSQAHANPDGSLTKLSTPEGSTQHFRYNSERLLTEAVDGNGNKTKYTYGAFDLLDSQTLPNGETLTFHYDKLTRLTEVRNSQGDSYRYAYDKAGQLIKETDFTGRVREYAYDPAGRLTRTVQADGSIETYSYDEEDKLLSRQTWQVKKPKAGTQADTTENSTEEDKKTSQKTTALLSDKTTNLNPEDFTLVHQVSYSYTKKTGQLTKTINTQYLPYYAEHITEFEYNEQHRLIAEIQDGERVEVELDKYGRQTGFSLPNGGESEVRILQGFNQYGELTQFQVDDHNPLNLSYDKLGRQTRKQNQNGFILAEHFSPSGLLQAQGGGWHNNLTEEQLDNYQPNHTYPIAGTQISRKWQYDKAFNLTHTQDNHWGATEYRVNKNGQVTDVLNGIRSSEHYRYDSQLNLTQKVQRETNENGQYQLQAANDATYGIKHRHGRITRYGNKTYKYDELGRLQTKTETKKGFRPVTTYYKWNSQSQLVELHSPHKGTWRYEYDAFGRRITKYQVQTDQAATTDPNNPYKNQLIDMPIRPNQDYWHKISELWENQEKNEQAQNEATENETEKTLKKTTALSDETTSVINSARPIQGYRYLYKQDQLVAEAPLQITATDGNPALQAEGRQELLQANWADAIYWLYQENDFTPTARYEKGQLHYTVADQVGTITELLTEDGYIDYRQKLNLWGEAEIDGHRHYAANDTNALKCNHRFVGQYYDEESELHYNRFRYYSPETGQYLSHDPIGLLGGFNPYGYVAIPTAFIDPLGLAECLGLPSSREKGGTGVDYNKDTGQGLYVLKDPITGEVKYVGRGDAPARGAAHQASPDKGKYTQQILAENNLTKAEAKYLEQRLMDHFGGAKSTNPSTNLLNKIRSYSPFNKNAATYDTAGGGSNWGNQIFSDVLKTLNGG
ncbi:RHS repeat-associated core domain-containing protein [Aggregatibacter kilianii]|uniref:RHS repeat-associated core domain-containing protein n=1 Tax=Aggregatibacter kilianii TaxID=2025884 RepID=UPI001EF93ECC|nr:RHS repeat-associated core domain-containing protein [Aggregatibacter kilianii]